jgi:cysteine synthase
VHPHPRIQPRRRILADEVNLCVSDLIGATPLFELVRTSTGSRLLLKLEQCNPIGTAKIRMARQMVLDAEQRGELRPGGHIIESTSGNTGLGLAVIAAERGYRFTAIVDRHACRDKLRAMKAMGTHLVYVTADGNENLATAAREELAARLAQGADNTVFTEQHNNPSNAVGYHSVAHELTAALPEGVDYLIGSVGTGGSLCGTGRELRRVLPQLVVIGVEPVGSIAFGGPGDRTTSRAPARRRAPGSERWWTSTSSTRAAPFPIARHSAPRGSSPAGMGCSSAGREVGRCMRPCSEWARFRPAARW